MKTDASDWQQWDNESRKAYLCFEAYMDLGSDATVKAAAKKTKCRLRTAEYWSVKFAWARRRASHDRYLSETSRRKADQQIIAARVRHASQAHAVEQVLLQPAVELSRRISAGTFSIEALSNEKLIELTIRAGAVLPRVQDSERRSLGDTENYMPMPLDQAQDTLTEIVEEDPEAAANAARLIQRIGEVQESRLAAEVEREQERRAQVRSARANDRDYCGTIPSINNPNFVPTQEGS